MPYVSDDPAQQGALASLSQTPLASDSRSPDCFFAWILLAAGALISAVGFATTWSLLLMDVRWRYPPHCPTSPSKRRAAPKSNRGWRATDRAPRAGWARTLDRHHG